MKTKSFKTYLEQRLNKTEIAEIESAAKIEHETLHMLQQDIANAAIDYMTRNKLGFNDLVKKLGKSPSHVSKIVKGQANLTLASIAQIYAIMGYKAHIVIAK